MFVEHLGSGGAEKVAVNLANGLAARGFSVDMLMWRGGGVNEKDLAPNVGVINFSGAGSKKPGALGAISLLAKYHRRYRPVTVFAHLEKPSIVAIIAGLLAGSRVTIPCIHIDLITYAKINHPIKRGILNAAVMVFYPLAPRVIAVSQGAADAAKRLIFLSKKSVHVIYNGFDLSRLKAISLREVAQPWLNIRDVPVIISCGRLQQQKAFDVLLRAFAALRGKRAARLIILGEGPEHERLRGLAGTLGIAADVMLPGFVPDPISWFAKSDLFVMSSRCEGHPLVLIEALVSGVPVISTDCPSGPREVLGDGRFGELVAVDDVDALSAAMSRAIETRPAIDQAAVAEHLKKFSLTGMIDGYEALVDARDRSAGPNVRNAAPAPAIAPVAE
jgi:glycosyltransferase involved in cell wall biosynthesis